MIFSGFDTSREKKGWERWEREMGEREGSEGKVLDAPESACMLSSSDPALKESSPVL